MDLRSKCGVRGLSGTDGRGERESREGTPHTPIGELFAAVLSDHVLIRRTPACTSTLEDFRLHDASQSGWRAPRGLD